MAILGYMGDDAASGLVGCLSIISLLELSFLLPKVSTAPSASLITDDGPRKLSILSRPAFSSYISAFMQFIVYYFWLPLYLA